MFEVYKLPFISLRFTVILERFPEYSPYILRLILARELLDALRYLIFWHFGVVEHRGGYVFMPEVLTHDFKIKGCLTQRQRRIHGRVSEAMRIEIFYANFLEAFLENIPRRTGVFPKLSLEPVRREGIAVAFLLDFRGREQGIGIRKKFIFTQKPDPFPYYFHAVFVKSKNRRRYSFRIFGPHPPLWVL